MRVRIVFCMGLMQLAGCDVAMGQRIPSLDQILSRIQDTVKEFEFSLPDFTCDERITSKELVGGKVARPTIIESVFIGTQKKGQPDRPFTESRVIKTIDGRQPRDGHQLEGPFLFGGGFSSILDTTFAENNIQYHNYKIAGIEKLAGRTVLVIEFATKPDQRGLNLEFSGAKLLDKDTGRAWIDLESMRVVRLERRYLNLPSPAGMLTVSVDYTKVVINGRTFWMPKTVRAEQSQTTSKNPASGQYLAEYSNYRKFSVSVKIQGSAPSDIPK